MNKFLALTLLVSLLAACDSDGDEPLICANVAVTEQFQDLIYSPPIYAYATENTNDACYEHGLRVIEELERSYYSYDGVYPGSCSFAEIQSSPGYFKKYRLDSIEEKFVNDFDGLNAAEVEELTNLICGREFGNENYKIDSLESFTVVDGELIVEYTNNTMPQTKTISADLDSKFNCPLYSFSCRGPSVD